MLKQFNSLTARLILIAVLGVGLLIVLGLIGLGTIGRLIVINESVADAEDQENILLTIQTLTYQAAQATDQKAAFMNQIAHLMQEFDEGQAVLAERYELEADDPAVAQVIVTIDQTNTHWAETSTLLDEFMTTDQVDLSGLVEEIGQHIITTNVYANRTSESFQAVAEREQQYITWVSLIVGVLSLGTVALIVSLILDVIREMRGLTRTATAFSAGDFSVRANVRGLTEVAALGETLNQMADSIQSREADLHEANETLEQRVRERAVQLELATAEAREASRAKDEFLSVMSHELRTPLNAILGYQGILELTGGLEGDNLDMVQRTGSNARRLLGLINDVLDISRIEAGRMAIVPSKLIVRDFIQQIRTQMEVLASDKNLQFEVEVDDSVPSIIRIDEDALTKIVTNLLGNAFKFTHTGMVSLSMKARAGALQIDVKDTGIGIPVTMQQIIFERFRQVDSSTTRNYGGSGLGLSIVQQLCALMGGTVVVNSAPHEGSTFTVTLPLEAVAQEREAA